MTVLAMFWNISRIYFFFYSMQIIKSNCYVIFLKFLSNHLFLMEICSYQVMFLQKRFNLCYSLWIFFLFPHNLTRLLQHIESIYYLFLLVAFCILSNQGNQYMVCFDWDLFYDIYNTITEHNQRNSLYFSLSPNCFDIYFLGNQKVILQLHLLHH